MNDFWGEQDMRTNHNKKNHRAFWAKKADLVLLWPKRMFLVLAQKTVTRDTFFVSQARDSSPSMPPRRRSSGRNPRTVGAFTRGPFQGTGECYIYIVIYI